MNPVRTDWHQQPLDRLSVLHVFAIENVPPDFERRRDEEGVEDVIAVVLRDAKRPLVSRERDRRNLAGASQRSPSFARISFQDLGFSLLGRR
jgi:hypothetical protein